MCITAHIQCSGTPKGLGASVTKAAKRSTDKPPARCVANNDRSAHAASLDNLDDAKSATMHTIVPQDRKGAIVLAAIKGEAPKRRPNGPLNGRCTRWRREL
jgi:hypothetical protein